MPHLDPANVRLLDEDAETRREAAAVLDATSLPGRYALRQVLLTDTDAEVRAIAARRLGDARDKRFVPALLDALADVMPSVRDRAWRALARMGSEALLPYAARAVREEPVWWVRRAAVRAAASVAGAGALELLLLALEDPFWRVRNAAVQALAWLGEGDASVRERVLAVAEEAGSGAVKSAGVYLRAVWGGEAPASGELVPAREAPCTGLADEDPAVTTARLERTSAQDVSALDLVEWLGDPHEPLRTLARHRLLERKDPEAARLVMRWLDEPRVPHASDEARIVLARLDVDVVALASRILEEAPRPGAVGWASRVAAGRAHAGLLERVRVLACHEDAAVRRAALSGLVQDPESRDVVLAALGDADASVRETVLAAWEQRPNAPEAQEAYARALVDFAPRAHSPRERRAVVGAAAFLDDEALLARLCADEDVSVRAMALAARVRLGELSEAERRELVSHEDPWIRAAVLDEDSALEVAGADPDATVRRTALDLLATHRRMLSPEELRAVALTGANAQDAWMRARGAELLRAEADREELSALLRLSLDTVPMVRASAASALEACEQLDTCLLELLLGPEREEDPDVRISAYTWLLRRADGPAFQRLSTALRSASEPERVTKHLEALTLIFPEDPFADAPDIARRRPVAPKKAPKGRARLVPEVPAHSSWRPLGRTGLTVSPLVLSGANPLAPEVFEEAQDAGINAFFWEPRYAQLTQFLKGRGRREKLVVAAGTYHSGPEPLRRDVEAALRRLRTDYLDVFLLFWVRSRERLNAEDFATLEALRDEGKVRAFGFSTHHRELAVEALRQRPWPVVMTRHSAAHPGAEAALFPEAREHGTGILTFTATCYGRLLKPLPGEAADAPRPSAVDCYRYSLSQPGVSASLTAPRSHRELKQNLEVLARPWMVEDVLPGMRARGAQVRTRNQQFNALVRQAPGGTRDALLALLDEDGPEADGTPSGE